MSRIYKKTNFAGSDSLTGIAFGGGGGGGGNNAARKSAQERRAAQYGSPWSESACSTLSHVTAVAGTISTVSGYAPHPAAKALSGATGIISAAGTSVYYDKCN